MDSVMLVGDKRRGKVCGHAQNEDTSLTISRWTKHERTRACNDI